VEEFKLVPIGRILESQTNPRKNFRDMEDLTKSIEENGVLVPLLVREKDGFYEIIAGARRYRAALEACCLELPVIVKEVTDDQALEIQVLENLQRVDVHPLEEAMGYKALLDRPGYDVTAVAAKVGKSESYIYQRIKLTELIQPAQDAFLEDKITAGHALLIARLQPDDQVKALEYCFDEGYHGYRNEPEVFLIPVRELATWIEETIHLNLGNAPFKPTDDKLIPDVGSCVECHKRTGFVPALFPDIKDKDTCTDRACYENKIQAHIEKTIAKAEKKRQDLARVSASWNCDDKSVLTQRDYHLIEGKEDACEHSRKGIVVDGYGGRGRIIEICTDPECKVHAKAAQSTGSSDWEKKQKEAEARRKKEAAIRQRIFEAIAVKAKDEPWDRRDWELLANTLLDLLGPDKLKIIADFHGWQGDKQTDSGHLIVSQIPSLSSQDLFTLIIELCIVRHVHVPSWGDPKRPEILNTVAARFGVDVKEIEKPAKGKKKTKSASSETKPKKSKTKASKPAQEWPASCDDCVNTDNQECAGCPNA
jgi:ParB family chromosome partitioning protein